jgi:hypothetical protein
MRTYHIEQCKDDKEYWAVINDYGDVVIECPNEELAQQECDWFNEADNGKTRTPEEYFELWCSKPKR